MVAMATWVLLGVIGTVVVGGHGAKVAVATGSVMATTSNKLTSVTIDICALKDGLKFNDPLLVALSSHLAPTVLRIGGTDQNDFGYDMGSDQPMICECHKPCTMTAPYWHEVNQFLEATGLSLLFGLSPMDADNANSLIYHSAHQGYKNILGYAWGNEQTGDASFAAQYKADISKVRTALFEAANESGIPRPLLIGADTGVGPRKDTVPANMSSDAYIAQHLKWIELFTATCGGLLDAVSWHTYDFRSTELGGADHTPLPTDPIPANFAKFWSPEYHDVVDTLAENVTAIVRKNAPALAGSVWLTETNSICHQGVYNVTDRFANSVWLADRLGLMASRGTTLMARQSLIGFNYSLLGNFPADPIKAAPDYFTTVLFRKLTGDRVLRASVEGAAPGATLRTYGFCGPAGVGAGGVVVLSINLSPATVAEVEFDAALGPPSDYVLSPGWATGSSGSATLKTTSDVIELNGVPLEVGSKGELPVFAAKKGRGAAALVLQPLTFAFSSFPSPTAPVPACA